MARDSTLRIPHPVAFTRAPERVSRPDAGLLGLQLRLPPTDLNARPDPFEDPRWEISLRPDDLEDEEDD